MNKLYSFIALLVLSFTYAYSMHELDTKHQARRSSPTAAALFAAVAASEANPSAFRRKSTRTITPVIPFDSVKRRSATPCQSPKRARKIITNDQAPALAVDGYSEEDESFVSNSLKTFQANYALFFEHIDPKNKEREESYKASLNKANKESNRSKRQRRGANLAPEFIEPVSYHDAVYDSKLKQFQVNFMNFFKEMCIVNDPKPLTNVLFAFIKKNHELESVIDDILYLFRKYDTVTEEFLTQVCIYFPGNWKACKQSLGKFKNVPIWHQFDDTVKDIETKAKNYKSATENEQLTYTKANAQDLLDNTNGDNGYYLSDDDVVENHALTPIASAAVAHVKRNSPVVQAIAHSDQFQPSTMGTKTKAKKRKRAQISPKGHDAGSTNAPKAKKSRTQENVSGTTAATTLLAATDAAVIATQQNTAQLPLQDAPTDQVDEQAMRIESYATALNESSSWTWKTPANNSHALAATDAAVIASQQNTAQLPLQDASTYQGDQAMQVEPSDTRSSSSTTLQNPANNTHAPVAQMQEGIGTSAVATNNSTPVVQAITTSDQPTTMPNTIAPIAKNSRTTVSTDNTTTAAKNTKVSNDVELTKEQIQQHIDEAVEYIMDCTERCDCPLCGKNCYKKSKLKSHMNQKHGRKEFKCDYPQCMSGFSIAALLKQHRQSFHQENVSGTNASQAHLAATEATVANKQKVAQLQLQENDQAMQTDSSGTSSNSSSRATLKAPASNTHANDVELTKEQIQQHIDEAAEYIMDCTERCDCPLCGKNCYKKSKLKSHMNQTHGRKEFQCDYPQCMSRFSIAALLKQHRQSFHQENVSGTNASQTHSSGTSSNSSSSTTLQTPANTHANESVVDAPLSISHLLPPRRAT